MAKIPGMGVAAKQSQKAVQKLFNIGGKEVMENVSKQTPELFNTLSDMNKSGIVKAVDSNLHSSDSVIKAATNKDFSTITDIANDGNSKALVDQTNQQYADWIHPKPEPTQVDILKEGFNNASANKIRGMNAKVAGGFGEEGVKLPQATYADKGQHFMGKGGPGAITAIHHGFGLDDMMSAVRAHPSWQSWHEGANPIIKRIRESGFDFGNHTKNLTDVTDTLPNAFRQAEVTQAQEQIKSLGGWVNKDTLNDAFGGSKLSPRELDELETAHFTQARRNRDPNLTTEKYMDTYKSPTTGQAYREGSFPNIKIRDENDQVLEVLEIKTAKDHANRFNLMFDAYERQGRDMSAVKKKFKVSKRKIGSEIDIMGPDHKTIHNIIDDVLKKDPNTAMGKLELLKNNPAEMAKLNEDNLTALLIQAASESERVTYNVNLNRYNRLLQVFEKYNPGKNFESLDALGQQAFFFKHVAEISRKGGVIGNTLSRNQALVDIKSIPKGFKNIFGWESQVANIEATARDIAGKNY
tara:strand:- start:122 stop:1693 length:1572 start_codon:yes stop_codon:yes gene_type:complete